MVIPAFKWLEPAARFGVASRNRFKGKSGMDQGDKYWGRHGIFYQIYPRSFQDSNVDGVGDINGVIARLPYLKSLGIDAVWLSPIFPSPMADFGYDISDDTPIDPLFGTMADFDALVGTHKGSR